MENRYKITIDLKNKTITNNTTFKQGNAGTSVLEIALVDEGLPVDITGQTVKFNFLRSDNAVVTQNSTTGVTILDALTGKFECVLKDTTLAIDGKVEAEIVFTEGTDVLSSTTFIFYVDTSIGFLSIKYIASVVSKLEEWQNTFDLDELSRANTFATSQISRSTTFNASEASRSTVFNTAEELRETGEASRVATETERVNTFTANEVSRANTFSTSQIDRTTTFNASETSRSTAFNSAEELREIGEAGRVTTFNTNETARASAFNTAENLRKTGEDARVTAEELRETAFEQMVHVDANLELSQARGGKDSLDARLDTIESTATQLQADYTHQSVSAMKASTALAGNRLKTSGYYAINDGGGAEYVIQDATTEPASLCNPNKW